jgi:hypothetical protein
VLSRAVAKLRVFKAGRNLICVFHVQLQWNTSVKQVKEDAIIPPTIIAVFSTYLGKGLPSPPEGKGICPGKVTPSKVASPVGPNCICLIEEVPGTIPRTLDKLIRDEYRYLICENFYICVYPYPISVL